MGDPPRSKGGTAVKCNVPVAEAINGEGVLPERVQEALGQLIGAAREGLLALSVEVGLCAFIFACGLNESVSRATLASGSPEVLVSVVVI
jgi:hypothetical protein